MMRASITRTMATSKVNGFKLTMVAGKPEVEELSVIVAGKVSEKDALKVLQKEYGKIGITVGSIEVQEDLYEISVEDFLKYAKKVEKKNPENKNEEKVGK